jgi:hypothetical protein
MDISSYHTQLDVVPICQQEQHVPFQRTPFQERAVLGETCRHRVCGHRRDVVEPVATTHPFPTHRVVHWNVAVVDAVQHTGTVVEEALPEMVVVQWTIASPQRSIAVVVVVVVWHSRGYRAVWAIWEPFPRLMVLRMPPRGDHDGR